ncbi:DUF4261 domain-containing protein [Paenimyroides aestuarii]|uniref:DUF4261 domain-containing protein n=1 Tax=Paenimyroides aestuarii TaxID=2968490 RepID=A0ABY5NQM4_9FLAO|nr:DUF4261 domain-containing protein [Paenimyroides aestuarii]UUV20859.1 DUF4261 domain-containing protein [Paenimyroides aestuarii]
MGFFDKFKKKKENETPQKESNLLLSMPMFNSEESYSLNHIIDDLQNYWKLNVSEVSGDDSVTTFKIENETVAVAIMPVPVPESDLEPIFGFNYLWKNAAEEVPNHTNHAIVSVLASGTNQLERFKILTKVNASILRTSNNAIGIYQGTQTLLLPKNLYLDFADFLNQDMLPLQLWIYIGIINEENHSSIYTYGMKEFGKTEIEILKSPIKGGDLYEFLLPVLSYIIESDVTLKNGETIGFTAEQKIKITQSKGIYLEGETLKFEM